MFAQAQTATVYALQNGSDTGMANVKSRLTTLNIDASAINGTVKSISIYANGKETIAGPIIVKGEGVTTPAGSAPSAYASSGQSDVVMVGGGNKTCTAYLLPVNLQKGVKVTVQTEDGKFYSQDFTESIAAGANRNLKITNQNANNLWMATIPGNTYFSFLSTPGAHDAATSGVTGLSASASKCQGEDIATMLANGVRAFDIRPNYKNSSTITANNLYIFHGTTNTNVKYVDAMKTLVDFVKANPSEAISVIMVKEAGSGNTDRSAEMWNVLNACHSEYSAYMKLLDHSYYTLDDFRGKICYINRTGTECTNTIRITNWPDDNNITNYSAAIGGTCFANIQDKYNTNGTSKQDEIKEMLQMSSKNTEKKYFHYNFCSSAYKVFGNNPSGYASKNNPEITNYLNNGNITGPTGYLYADFIGSSNNGGAALLSAIINQNYRYVYNGRAAGGELTGENWDLAEGSNVIWSKKGNWADGYGASSGVYVTENYAGWGSLEQTDFALTRDVVLPAGIYTMKGYALYRDGAYAKLVAKSGSEILGSVDVAPMTSISTVGANDLEKAANAFTGSNYLNTLSFTLTEPTMVTVGYEGKHTGVKQWFVAGPVTLEKIADPELTARLKITSAQWGTFCAPFDVAVPEGVKAYTVAVEGDKLVYTEAESIEADKAYAVYSEDVFDETFSGKSIASGGEVKSGCLVGTYTLIDAPLGSYLLQKNDDVVGFYRVADAGLSVGANRCYLVNPDASAKQNSFLLSNPATAIEGLNAMLSGNIEGIYNAAGIKQSAMQKGMNVVKTAGGMTVKVMVK